MKTPIPLALGLLLLTTACGWEADGAARLAARYDQPDAAADGAEDTALPDVDLGDVGGEDLVGRWAVQFTVAGSMSPIGEAWPFLERTWFLAQIDADAVQARLTFCGQATTVDASLASQAEIPLALRDALASVPLFLDLDEHGIEAQSLPWLWGFDTATIDDLRVKPGGVDAGDRRLLDQDQDGKPGVTIHVSKPLAGDRYMARWERWDLDAAALSPDGQRIEGTLAADLAEYPLGADPDMLNKDAKLVADPAGHGHRWRRVPGDYGCDELLTDAPGLFPEAAE